MDTFKSKRKNIEILECTLRDGGYAIGYKFTLDDVALVCNFLESCGFRWIEIGHGVGLGGSRHKGVAAATDKEYIKTARRNLKRARFGTFFIPNIGEIKDLEMASGHGMDFVRIGVNITESETSLKYIKKAKRLGLFVASNLMKTYAVGPEDFAIRAEECLDSGTDVIYIVDSAGCMVSDEINEYIYAILKRRPKAKIGFHGHNNLGMVVANCLDAAKKGVRFIDVSMRGIGRSAGNAQSEILTPLLEKLNFSTGVDIERLFRLSEKIMRNITSIKWGLEPQDIVAGLTRTHSSFLPLINRIARQNNIDPIELIKEVSKKEIVDVNEKVVQTAALELIKRGKRGLPAGFNIPQTVHLMEKSETSDLKTNLQNVIDEIEEIANKTKKSSVFTIAERFSLQKRDETRFPYIRQIDNYIVGNAEVSNLKDAEYILKKIDGKIDFILINSETDNPAYEKWKTKARSQAAKSTVLFYSDKIALIETLDIFISQMINSYGARAMVIILGIDDISLRLGMNLVGKQIKVCYISNKNKDNRPSGMMDIFFRGRLKVVSDDNAQLKEAGFILGTRSPEGRIDRATMNKVKKDCIIIDAGIGSVTKGGLDIAKKRNLRLFRPDMRAGLSAEVIKALLTYDLLEYIAGKIKLGNIPIVAGGVFGSKGSIVVDSIFGPGRVIGIADGNGSLMDEPLSRKDKINIEKVKKWMIKNLVKVG